MAGKTDNKADEQLTRHVVGQVLLPRPKEIHEPNQHHRTDRELLPREPPPAAVSARAHAALEPLVVAAPWREHAAVAALAFHRPFPRVRERCLGAAAAAVAVADANGRDWDCERSANVDKGMEKRVVSDVDVRSVSS